MEEGEEEARASSAPSRSDERALSARRAVSRQATAEQVQRGETWPRAEHWWLYSADSIQERCTSHSVNALSLPPVASARPSGLQAHVITVLEFCSVATQFLVAASHSFIVMSPLPDAMVRPSGLQAHDITVATCPLRVAVQLYGAAADQSFSVLSSLAVTIVLPSGLHAQLHTLFVLSPRKIEMQLRAATSHSATRSLPVQRLTTRPSGLHAQQTNVVWSPVNDAVQLRVVTSHTFSVLPATDASERPSGLHEHDHTLPSSCSSSVARQPCVTASHNFIVLSQAQEAIVRPSGLQEQAKIHAV